MRKTALLLFVGILLCCANSINAQSTVIVSGYVTNSATQQPLANKYVGIIDSNISNLPIHYYYKKTDSNGWYSDTITVTGNGFIQVYIYDCAAVIHDTVIPYAASAPTYWTINKNFSICVPPPLNCYYTVSASQQANYNSAPNTASFYVNYQAVGSATYYWDFGDGTTSSYKYPTHTYGQSGTYNYCLTVNNCPPVCGTITLVDSTSCDASFTKSRIGNTVYITLASAGGLGNFTINWGDGTSFNGLASSVNGPLSHSYVLNSTYTLDVHHKNGYIFNCQVSDTIQISQALNCDAGFTKTINGSVASLTLASAGVNAGYVYVNWGDGTFYSSPAATAINPITHTYSGNGSYPIVSQHFINFTNVFCEVKDTIQITQSTNCNPYFTKSINGKTASLFPVVAGGLGNIAVDWGDGATTNTTAALVNGSLSHTYANFGNYVVNLSHYFPNSNDSCYMFDSIYTNPSLTCDANFTTQISNLDVEISPVSISSYGTMVINWGDGTFNSFNTNSSGVILKHTYAQAGNYNICLQHSVSNYCTDNVCHSISVSANSNVLSCSASYTIDTAASQNGSVNIWNNSAHNGGPGITTTTNWSFGDGSFSNQAYPSHHYTNPGKYQLCVLFTAYNTATNDTCFSYFCDSVGVDSNGNLLYKGALVGWDLNIMNPASFSVHENNLSKVKTYPNPVNDKLYLDMPEELSGISNYSLYNITGAKILEGNSIVNGQPTEIYMGNLPNGLYILQLEMNGDFKQIKVLKQATY